MNSKEETFISILRNKERMGEVKQDVANLYNILSSNKDKLYLNFGYLDLSQSTNEKDPSEQLILELIKCRDLNNKKILDVGCGRGGTVSTIAHHFNFDSITGIDITPAFIDFCQNKFKNKNIHFMLGDAENLNFEDNTFDIVTNVESSHNYPNINQFYSEVYRVLKPGGFFLYTDFHITRLLEKNIQFIKNLGFELLIERDITSNVLAAREKHAQSDLQTFLNYFDTEDKKDLLTDRFSNFCSTKHNDIKDFMATTDSEFYKAMVVGVVIYSIHQFQKPLK